jgi:hypothetical protein
LRRLLAGLSLLVLATAAGAEPVVVTSETISSFQRLSYADAFGPFTFLGGLTLTSGTENFGGFSGLVLGRQCEELLAVSDRGNWLQGRLFYEADRLAGLGDGVLSPIRDSRGGPQRRKSWADAESVTRLRNGRLAVGFERRVRFGSYDIANGGLSARFEALPHPQDIEQGPENGEVEALGEISGGRLIAIAERQFDQRGNIRGWVWSGKKATGFTLEPYEAYEVTDLAVDGEDVLTLERRFTAGSLPGMAVRRFSVSGIEDGKTVRPELLLEATAPLHVIDNMEAIALCERDGKRRMTLMSDNNFNTSVQSTILLQFAYRR